MRRILLLVGALATSAPALSAQQLVATRLTPVHLLPSGDSRKIGAIRSGERLLFLTATNGFVRVLLPNYSVGWVDTTDVRAPQVDAARPELPPALRVVAALEPRNTPALPQSAMNTQRSEAAVQQVASTEPGDLTVVQQGAVFTPRSPVALEAAFTGEERAPARHGWSLVQSRTTTPPSWSWAPAPRMQPIAFTLARPAFRDPAPVLVESAAPTPHVERRVEPASRGSCAEDAAYRDMPFTAVLDLPPRLASRGVWTGAQKRQVDGSAGRPVSVDGYIVSWETASPAMASCEPTGHDWHDWRLWLVRTESEASRRDRSRAIIIEFAERTSGPGAGRVDMRQIRRWAREGDRVRVSGRLLLDTARSNGDGAMRGTLWEIAPAARFEPAP